MQISSLIDIVDGKLLNSPSISFIYSFKTNPLKVKEGDLFIAKNIDDIKIAVNNGAFAIILETMYPIIDNEIAWIKVESINLSLIQLIRFKLANFNLTAFYCDEITYSLLESQISLLTNIKLLSNDMNEFINCINYFEDKDILISKDKNILNKIYPNNSNFNNDIYEITNLTEHSLFEVSFTYNDFYFSKLKISSMYIPQFISVYNFLNKEIDFLKIKNFMHMKPIFLDKNLEVIDFGKSEKFLLLQNKKELLLDEIRYINSRYKYGKLIYITNKYIKELGNKQIIIDNILSLKKILKNNFFNLAYIYGFDYIDIQENLTKLEKQNSLF